MKIADYNKLDNATGNESQTIMSDLIPPPIRVGAVSYLNSKPLIEDLEDLAENAELMLDYPSLLADDLAEGRIDVGLIPSIEVIRNSDYEIISNACVATQGPVLSVKMYSYVPLGKIKRLALDMGSRTSATLVQIMLAEQYGVFPEVEPLPMDQSIKATTADAILLIGDRAIHTPDTKFAATWDLGEEWLRWTGLPFVFAMWAVRKNQETGSLASALCQARDRGVTQLDEIARREAPKLGIEVSVAQSYLKKNLSFHLGPAECCGLQLFQELAIKTGLAPEGVPLVFRNCISAG
ncbi:MAG: menaquinone biosynthesis protein [Planctomycetes bacterium]|nr:menaquinone biosynthesis protein [Planctomycetota bacterium]MCH9725917.1 menaquinone biosynthesis protein [Planctomycetota bacterium]MCH9777070.1 menaquinone biosynthesis protein [Planctomycetota bacterium]MCH9789968.1 menaquinone biosynthesis protein [Planctomycetota bacterium]